MSVLLIEDDETIGEAVCSHLTAAGEDVFWAKTLAEGRAALASCDVVILDLQLPDGEGLAFIAEIRAGGVTTPLIVVSSVNDVRRRLDCLRAGADDYLATPFHLRELALRVRRLSADRSFAGRIAAAEPPPRCKAAAEPQPARRGAWARLRGYLSVNRPIVAIPLAVAVTMGGYLGYLQISGNFHTVIEGELYRSGQPTAHRLERYIVTHGIRTVVNLRGPSAQDWYKQEVATAARLNVRHIDFAMSSGEELTPARADEIVALLKDAPKPILIHCRAGSDRTGLVSVLYTARIAGQPESRAERQLSVFYGHIALPYISSTFAMDESWEMLERYYGINEDIDRVAAGEAALDEETG